MHAPFVKSRCEMQAVVCEAENDVALAFTSRFRENRDIEEGMT